MEHADYLNLFEVPLLSIPLSSLHRSAGRWCDPEPPPQTPPAALQAPDCPSDKSRKKLVTRCIKIKSGSLTYWDQTQTHLCELVDRHQQENGMKARCYQGHGPLRLLPHALLHLASGPVPPRRLHKRDVPLIECPASKLAAPGAAVRAGGQLTQDGVCRRRLATSDVSQQDELHLGPPGPIRTSCPVSTHGCGGKHVLMLSKAQRSGSIKI